MHGVARSDLPREGAKSSPGTGARRWPAGRTWAPPSAAGGRGTMEVIPRWAGPATPAAPAALLAPPTAEPRGRPGSRPRQRASSSAAPGWGPRPQLPASGATRRPSPSPPPSPPPAAGAAGPELRPAQHRGQQDRSQGDGQRLQDLGQEGRPPAPASRCCTASPRGSTQHRMASGASTMAKLSTATLIRDCTNRNTPAMAKTSSARACSPARWPVPARPWPPRLRRAARRPGGAHDGRRRADW